MPGRTKLGVVGRTGAGKSSLIAALFRIVEPSGGELLIDGVNVLNMSLHTLRNNVAIVPQVRVSHAYFVSFAGFVEGFRVQHTLKRYHF